MKINEVMITEDVFDSIIAHLKQSPKITDPRKQFRNDPGGHHKAARGLFHTKMKQQMAGYRAGILRSNIGSSRIAFLTFVGIMQRECGARPTGIFDVATVRLFQQNQDKFNDAYISSRVKSNYDPTLPTQLYDVVRMIENASTGGEWSSAYASYWNYTGGLDFGIGPGQVEPNTYIKDVKKYVPGANFDFKKWEHVTSIDMLTKAMTDTIRRKLQIVKPGAGLRDFADAWNHKKFHKADSITAGNPKIPLKAFRTAKATTTKEEPKMHTVAKGETLYSIAQQYKTDVDSIKSLNNLASNNIQIGQQLKLN